MDLTKPLPKTITVGGKQIPIRTDFRSWLRFDRALLQTEVSYPQRLASALSFVLVKKRLPADFMGLLGALLSFYACEKVGGAPKKKRRTGAFLFP